MQLRSNIVAIVMGVFAAIFAPSASASIVVGPWTFEDDAFADNAIQLDSGTLEFVGEPTPTTLNEALTGYSPNTGLYNTGFAGRANQFQLDFTKPMIQNGFGPDFVFFDARFSADDFAIAVRPLGGVFTPYVSFASGLFVDAVIDGPHNGVGSDLYGLEVNLSSTFKLLPGTVVDAIRFHALDGIGGFTEGDPVMAGALNVVPEPATLLLLAVGAFFLRNKMRRQPKAITRNA